MKGGGMAVLAALVLAGCGAAVSAPSPTARPTPRPTVDAKAATAAYLAAYTALYNVETADVGRVNSQNVATSTAAITERIAAHKAFDAALVAMTIPRSAIPAATALVDADLSLENNLGTLAANRSNVTNYNAMFTAIVPVQNAFDQANLTFAHALGAA